MRSDIIRFDYAHVPWVTRHDDGTLRRRRADMCSRHRSLRRNLTTISEFSVGLASGVVCLDSCAFIFAIPGAARPSAALHETEHFGVTGRRKDRTLIRPFFAP
jgi:hypothetical protein